METRRKLRMVAAVCVLVVGLTAPGLAKMVYVDDDAKESGKGTSWTDPCKYLQTALTAASTGDEIRVAQGVYRSDQGLPVSRAVRPRSGSTPDVPIFQLKSGVKILGGFGGVGAEDPEARDIQRYRTILTGDLNGDDTDLWGPGHPVYEILRADNSLHVVQSIGTDATAVLDGFVIEGAVDSGFLNQGGSPSISNCVFRKGSSAKSGGALRCEGGQPTLTNCLFQENCSTGSRGGAIDISSGRLTLSNCRFLDNWAWQVGGAICCTNGDLILTGCTFEKNVGSWGGALSHEEGVLKLADCVFEDNAAGCGGAVAFNVGAASLTRCTFARNWAVSLGGAVSNEGGVAPTFDQCTFTGNTANEGGAIHALRIVVPIANPGMVLTHCLFTGNRAYSNGAALFDDNLGFVIRGCTFAGNWAQGAATFAWRNHRAADAMYRTSLDNCIMWDGSGSIARTNPTSRTGTSNQDDVTIRYSDVQGGWAGEGNINLDPRFAALGRWVDRDNPEVLVTPDWSNAVWIDGDCHLRSQAGRWDPAKREWVKDDVTSPCIDAGDPKSSIADEPQPNGGRANMGAEGGTTEASKSVAGTGEVME